MAVWQTNNIAASADRCRKEEETMNRSSRTVKLVEMALLVAIILILAFTPLGYIKTLGLEITLIVVPVTIGAIYFRTIGRSSIRSSIWNHKLYPVLWDESFWSSTPWHQSIRNLCGMCSIKNSDGLVDRTYL